MKPIELRAYIKSLKMFNSNAFAKPTTRELLVEMATEQREIDIDKAIKAHCEICVMRSLCVEKSILNDCPETEYIRNAINE